jgi:hypothetical protein
VRTRALLALAFLLVSAGPAAAQLERVYGFELPAPGMPELSLWTGYVAKSDRRAPFFGRERAREGLWAHAIEAELGITPQLALGAYLDAEQPDGEAFTYTQARLVARYNLMRKHDLPIDIGFYAEYYLPRPGYGPEHLELRVTLEKDLGDFRVRVNPILDKVTSGQALDPTELEYAAGAYFRRWELLQPGIEAFGSTGPLQRPHRAAKQRHMLYAVIDLRLWNSALHWHLGAGLGFTRGADDLTIKSILSYEPAPSYALRAP